jgi:tetratricopeptide (TPR) repeat protein
MNAPILATTKRAPVPYTFPRLLFRIWSAEELCYLFQTNPFILDTAIIDRKLVNWLGEECALPELARELDALLGRRPGDAAAFVAAIFDYVNYLTAEESQRIAEIMQGNIDLSECEREMNRADFLLSKGKWQAARREYERILLILPEGERLLLARAHHGCGVALARLFMFEQAATSFLTAYELSGRPESGRAYLACIRLKSSDAEYIRFVAERPSFEDFSLEVEHIYNQALSDYNETDEKLALDDLILDKAMGNGSTYYSGVEGLVENIKQDYRTAAEV